MNLFKLIQQWIVERGSAASLRDHVDLLKGQNTVLTAALEECKAERKLLQIENDDQAKQINVFQSFQKPLKNQAVLEQEIRRLQNACAECERQLRIRSIGF